MEDPVVSVIIPCHNHAKFLGECIESVLSQTYKNLDIIVVDDESTDNTFNIADQYPVRYFYIKHSGAKTPANAHNFGIKKSNGKYIIFLGADDKIQSSYVELCLEIYLTNQADIGFVWTGCQEFGSSQKTRMPSKMILGSEKDAYINPNGQLGAMMVPKEVYQKVGPYDLSLEGLEDWDWILRALRAGYIGISIQKVLHYARVHPQRLTNTVLQNHVINQLYSKYPHMKNANLIHATKLRVIHPITTFKNLRKRLQKRNH